ncbi:Z1 domain-containing protein [Streptomyces sp. TP-A0874]|uniref:Z1 domain-containing protein n=1 Tax=Streptomyces sp. TP-A0874 TaxID=549819 RepID=UPI000853A6A9|nr:Z1 domain-containing protein [Streptomyces sp. TP-A0874]
MTSTTDDVPAKAKRLVRSYLPGNRQPSPEELQEAVDVAYGMLTMRGEDLDRERLHQEMKAMFAVFQAGALGLVNNEGHIPWLPEAKNDRDWDFWERYRWYMEDVLELPSSVVRRLDQTTDEVLGQLEDPRRQGPWLRKGLVVGQVQSGKTGQYIGLGAKAVDAGYRLIVVLAGVHNDLRSQTQLRIDEGLLGFDTQHQMRSNVAGNFRAMGAGLMPLGRKLDIASPTNSSEKGDFGKAASSTINFPLGSFPVVLVVKKHWRILDYLRRWVVDVQGREEDNGRRKVYDVPLLVIDDEADNASINTKKEPDADPTKTNKAIRDLLVSFDRAAYVGYTATPFANIYIDPDAKRDDIGDDLFPESFIRTLRAPTNYLGPERVFGLNSDDEYEDDVEPLPLVRPVLDAEPWLRIRHRGSERPKGDIPQSLRTAIASFLLACAARRARGQEKVHNSMLVHVTRFTAVQNHVREQVEDHLHLLVDSLRDRHGQGPKVMADLQALWESDFAVTTKHFAEDEAKRLTWEEVSAELLDAARKIQVKVVNGSSQDALEYFDHRDTGLSVIAVGGQKLSRGLTLEGLTVSYYLRWANTYDSLLQMGRWFGYRPGYEDLCRLYTTPEVEEAYAEVTEVLDELRREMEEMATRGMTPREFGLKVRTSSLGLLVTARNKMHNGKKVLISYSGEGPETTIFNLSRGTVSGNLKALESLVRHLDETMDSKPSEDGGSVVWEGAPPEAVSEFLYAYETDRKAFRVRPNLIAKYIDQCARGGELANWSVKLVGKASEDPVKIAGRRVGPVTRSPHPTASSGEGRYTIRRVLSPKDEKLGLTDAQWTAALEDTKERAAEQDRKAPEVPAGADIRAHRSPTQGALLIYPIKVKGQSLPLIGFQVSLPKSLRNAKIEYVANSVFLEEAALFTDEEEEEEESGV